MSSYRTIAFDCLTNLKMMFDDSDIRIPQIVWWIQVIANRLRSDDYQANNTGNYLSTYSSVTVQTDANNRQYIDLPVQILSMANERGIHYITYNEETCCCAGPAWAQVTFHDTTPAKAKRLYMDEYEKPSTKNPYFYRIGDKVDGVSVNRIYFLGTECIKLTDVEICLISELDPSQVCSLDDEIPLSPELVVVLQQELLKLGRFLRLLPSERINDGDDSSKGTTVGVPNMGQPSQVEPQSPTE